MTARPEESLPIAIIGRACVLPGALSPEELWSQIVAGQDLISTAPPGSWRVPVERVLCSAEAPVPDRTGSDRGGYVRGFAARFDPSGFALPAEEILALDPLVHWVLHCARAALRSAGYEPEPRLRAGAVFGNLSYPTSGLTRFAESIWLAEGGGAPGDRFMSGLPALLLARALRLEAGAFALDAACASGLYAVKLACDALADGRADLMLAGGVNRADDLFLHTGFSALGALSRSGRSRPFHRDADGLVPAEGAAFVLLKRLPDAVAAKDPILGVIRGIGLSNDGRGSGLLTPSESGQVRAMRDAYARAGLSPLGISLVECHATGTPVGDRVELRSTGEVFAGAGIREPVPIGSLKSNLGHLITAAGIAGLLKVLGAIEHRTRPPSLHAEAPLPELAGSPLRLLAAAEPWTCSGPARAAVSAFGFGGNNAHLVVEEWAPPLLSRSPVAAPAAPAEPVAIVGVGAIVGRCGSARDLARCLLSGEVLIEGAEGPEAAVRTDEIPVPLEGLRIPPSDLQQAQPQQLLILRAALEALGDRGRLPAERTGVLVGMGCDAEVARYTLRLRHPDRVQELDAVCAPLQAAGVLGAMPNLVANRLNSLLDLQGPSFTVSAEELSGLVALRLGVRALRSGELDACLVGAVDLSCEPVHRAAAAALLPGDRQTPADAAVALVLKRVADARRDGDSIYALILPEHEAGSAVLHLGSEDGALSLTPQLGHAHAASGLLHVACAALCCHHRALPQGPTRPAVPWLTDGEPRIARVSYSSFHGARESIAIRGSEDEDPRGPARIEVSASSAPRLRLYSGADRRALHAALSAGRESTDGIAQLAIVAGESAFPRVRDAALQFLDGDHETPPPAAPDGSGFYFRQRPLGGELAFVFTMAAAAYPGMGRELLLALPELIDTAPVRLPNRRALAQRIYGARGAESTPESPDLLEQLAEYSFLCQIHSALSQRILQIRPHAAIGLCTGESSALFALGAWKDLAEMLEEIRIAGVYDRELAGEFAAVRRAFRRDGLMEEVDWASWRVLVPVEEVCAAAAREVRAYVTLIHSPTDCILSGQRAACERALLRLGEDGRRRARELTQVMAIHCPEVQEVRERLARDPLAADRRGRGRALLLSREERELPARSRVGGRCAPRSGRCDRGLSAAHHAGVGGRGAGLCRARTARALLGLDPPVARRAGAPGRQPRRERAAGADPPCAHGRAARGCRGAGADAGAPRAAAAADRARPKARAPHCRAPPAGAGACPVERVGESPRRAGAGGARSAAHGARAGAAAGLGAPDPARPGSALDRDAADPAGGARCHRAAPEVPGAPAVLAGAVPGGSPPRAARPPVRSVRASAERAAASCREPARAADTAWRTCGSHAVPRAARGARQREDLVGLGSALR